MRGVSRDATESLLCSSAMRCAAVTLNRFEAPASPLATAAAASITRFVDGKRIGSLASERIATRVRLPVHGIRLRRDVLDGDGSRSRRISHSTWPNDRGHNDRSDMDLLYARWQMGLSLAFHIIFAVIGMAMPVMMVAAETAWLRTRQSEYLDLAKRWAKGTAILFAVGAVSGTVLSFELGLLWPAFMEVAGPIIGMPFSLEGFAFFLEAIFLGLYLYAAGRSFSPQTHVFAGIMVSIGGALSEPSW